MSHESIKNILILLALFTMLGLALWGLDKYSEQQKASDYSNVFRQHYNKGDKTNKDSKPYHGTKEKDIEKWKGDRFSTY
tara:strand:- start:64 stop:300 length:237 start_codon:yes stop_codon:yes gene_type:complete